MTEDIVDKLIKHWEEKIGIELDKNELKVVKEIAYVTVDESIERYVTAAKEIRERKQRFRGLGLVNK